MCKGKHVAPSKRRKSSKTLVLVIALALVLGLAIGGTIAYLIDKTNQVVNVFEPTDVSCRVQENLDGDLKTNVCVENTGSIDAYIRVVMVANYVNEDGYVCADHAAPALPTVTGEYWTKGADGYYYYSDPVEAGGYTELLIQEIAPVSTVAKADQTCFLSVEIIASAIQADGFAGDTPAVVDAWGNAVNNLGVSGDKISVTPKA